LLKPQPSTFFPAGEGGLAGLKSEKAGVKRIIKSGDIYQLRFASYLPLYSRNRSSDREGTPTMGRKGGATVQEVKSNPLGSATAENGNLWGEGQHPIVLIDPRVSPPCSVCSSMTSWNPPFGQVTFRYDTIPYDTIPYDTGSDTMLIRYTR
jgi:hypothetical protein